MRGTISTKTRKTCLIAKFENNLCICLVIKIKLTAMAWKETLSKFFDITYCKLTELDKICRHWLRRLDRAVPAMVV